MLQFHMQNQGFQKSIIIIILKLFIIHVVIHLLYISLCIYCMKCEWCLWRHNVCASSSSGLCTGNQHNSLHASSTTLILYLPVCHTGFVNQNRECFSVDAFKCIIGTVKCHSFLLPWLFVFYCHQ